MTARIHWARIAWTIAAVGSFGTAEAQISVHPQTTPARTVTTVAVPPAGILTVPFTRTPAPPPTETFNVPLKPSPPETIKIALGLGGSISAHRETYSRYNQGAKVEVRGPCYSACTLIVAHIDMDHICVGEGAILAFHAAQTTMDVQTAQRHQYATNLMYATYPVPIRAWIDQRGGAEKLPGPGQGYWTMYDRELWAMGYPKCK